MEKHTNLGCRTRCNFILLLHPLNAQFLSSEEGKTIRKLMQIAAHRCRRKQNYLSINFRLQLIEQCGAKKTSFQVIPGCWEWHLNSSSRKATAEELQCDTYTASPVLMLLLALSSRRCMSCLISAANWSNLSN